MAKIKDFLQQLENDPQLLRDYRSKKKNERKNLAKSKGLTETQAETLQSNDLAQIRTAIEQEDGGGVLLFVVMTE